MARVAWPLAGVVAGIAGLAVSHALTMALSLRPNPLVSAAAWFAGHLPGWVEDTLTELMGSKDAAPSTTTGAELLEPYLVALLFIGFVVVSAVCGQLARRGWWQPLPLQLLVGVCGVLALAGRYTFSTLSVVPVVAGLAAWMVLLSFVAAPLQRAREIDPAVAPATEQRWLRFDRRDFVVRGSVVGLGGLALWLYGGRFGQKRRRVEDTRRLLNLPIHKRNPRPEFRIGLDGVEPWRTRNPDFYVTSTGLVPPAVELAEWRLRITGLVERELSFTYQQLIERDIVEAWVTTESVTNPVGGPLIGNAWWSGILIRDLLAEAGVRPGADAVRQTDVSGWSCVTPLEALTDDRTAMLAIGMNGVPLPIEQGYPMRSVVPGLYDHVATCKWVTELKVTRFEDDEGYATAQEGYDERGPIKVSARIDTPGEDDGRDGSPVSIGGSAWAPGRGVAAVEVAVDDGPWLAAELARVPNPDTWVQWGIAVELEPGRHRVRARATAADGEVQTGVISDVLPNGATGWHEIGFEVS